MQGKLLPGLMILSSLALTACGQTRPVITKPPVALLSCQDEPLAPEGVDVSALPDGVAEWWFGSFLPWSRGNAVRLEQGQAWCLKRETPPPDS